VDLLTVSVEPDLTEKTVNTDADRIRPAVVDGENRDVEEFEALPDAGEIALIA
jgi:hypothetical protein